MSEQIRLMAEEISAERLKGWPDPMEVRSIAQASQNLEAYPATKAIWERILGNVIEVGCLSSSTVLSGSHTPHPRGALLLPGSYWPTLVNGSSEFWDGHVQFRLLVDSFRDTKLLLRCFGLRLNPDHVAREFPTPMRRADEDSATTKPHVRTSELTSWSLLFNQLYPDASEETALKSAQGFFQGKRVSVDEVRRLLRTRRGLPLARRPEG